jgi:hypothetical protein
LVGAVGLFERVVAETGATGKEVHPLTEIGRLATDMGLDDVSYAPNRLVDRPRSRFSQPTRRSSRTPAIMVARNGAD